MPSDRIAQGECATYSPADGAADAEGRRCRRRGPQVAAGASRWAPRCSDWGRRALGLTINEFYGQTECNMVASPARRCSRPARVASAAGAGPTRSGDRPPGAARRTARATSPGAAAASMMLEYGTAPRATAAKFRRRGMLPATAGEEGGSTVLGRDDDVITRPVTGSARPRSRIAWRHPAARAGPGRQTRCPARRDRQGLRGAGMCRPGRRRPSCPHRVS